MSAHECIGCGSIAFLKKSEFSATCELCGMPAKLPNSVTRPVHEFCVSFSPRRIVETAREYEEFYDDEFYQEEKNLVEFIISADEETLRSIALHCSWSQEIADLYWELILDAARQQKKKTEKNIFAAPAAELTEKRKK
jgi:hypothetical protein